MGDIVIPGLQHIPAQETESGEHTADASDVQEELESGSQSMEDSDIADEEIQEEDIEEEDSVATDEDSEDEDIEEEPDYKSQLAAEKEKHKNTEDKRRDMQSKRDAYQSRLSNLNASIAQQNERIEQLEQQLKQQGTQLASGDPEALPTIADMRALEASKETKSEVTAIKENINQQRMEMINQHPDAEEVDAFIRKNQSVLRSPEVVHAGSPLEGFHAVRAIMFQQKASEGKKIVKKKEAVRQRKSKGRLPTPTGNRSSNRSLSKRESSAGGLGDRFESARRELSEP